MRLGVTAGMGRTRNRRRDDHETAAGDSTPDAGWRGFTLVELLVVIAIIGVLVACCCRRFSGPRSRPATQCKNNLKQYRPGLHNYHDTLKTFPPGGSIIFKSGEHYTPARTPCCCRL